MLVLRRKIGESIILDGVISISVLAVEGERVKIGISAPPDVTIVREELLKSFAPDRENQPCFTRIRPEFQETRDTRRSMRVVSLVC
jgi:carbon storage regulator